MEFVELIIIVTIAITFSSIFSKMVPAIPSVFVQIFLGVILGISSVGQTITFDPDLFLVMIIAPLLFREGQYADIPGILKHFGIVLSLAFGGVLLTIGTVGLTLHWLLPIIPLAACFAFGAALGPTDVVAVRSLAGKYQLSEKALHILDGEGLLNDAAGVTAFQFAIASLLLGQFSAVQASLTLIISTIGGFIVGWGVVWLKQKIFHLIERASAQDVTAYMLIELLLPFVAYLVADLLGVSGIIAAVVAGMVQTWQRSKVTLFEAELANLSEKTWQTIVFTLNALVFIILGIQISQVFSPVWQSSNYVNLHVIGVILLISLLLFFVRGLFLVMIYRIKYHRQGRQKKRELLLLTFGGVRGTLSLATIFILPEYVQGLFFEERELLLFITAGVILVTLIVGVIALPLLAQEEQPGVVDSQLILILEEVVANLNQDVLEDGLIEKEQVALYAVINRYQQRIRECQIASLTKTQQQEVQELQGLILSIEQVGLDERFRRREVSENGYRIYSKYLQNFQQSITRQLLGVLGLWFLVVRRVVRMVLHPKMFWQRRQKTPTFKLTPNEVSQVYRVFDRNTKVILQSLDYLRDIYTTELVDLFIQERQNLKYRFKKRHLIELMIIQSDRTYIQKMLRGYYLQRKIIDEYEVAEKITTFAANEYRKEVNLLESYAMSQLGETGSWGSFLLKTATKTAK
ncbi:MAG: cation:proton antiporter [Enterococcus sp.]